MKLIEKSIIHYLKYNNLNFKGDTLFIQNENLPFKNNLPKKLNI